MKVRSYEPYHIGIKLSPDVNLDSLKLKLIKPLQDKNYDITREEAAIPVKITPPAETIASKKAIRVELNYQAQALNFIGEDPVKVVSVFRELNSVLTQLGYEIEPTVSFYEILASIIISSEKSPTNMINHSFKIGVKAFSDFGNITVAGFKLVNRPRRERREPMSLIIEPNPTSPSKDFRIRIQFRSNKAESIEAFSESVEGRIIRILRSLGSG